MKIIENHLLFEYFVLIVYGLRVTHGNVFSKRFTIWGNQNNHDDKPDQRMENRSKRSLFECGIHGQEPTIDILSGETTLPGEWPWVGAVVRSRRKEFTYQCGATLIDNRFAITAAHCIYNQFDQKQIETKDIAVIVGTRDVSRRTYDEDSTRFLTAMYMHEEYDSGTNRNNIALLVLKESVTHTKLVKSVCLWEGEDEHNVEKAIKHGTVVGWGEIDRVITLEAPHRFNMSIISFTTCREQNMEQATIINEKTFCAVKVGTKTICRGFSGAGLYMEQHGRWMLRGVISTALITDGTCGSTAVYTDIANYRNWISDTVYRWSQTNILPVAATTYATGNRLPWTQQCPMSDEVNSLVVGGSITREGEWPWHVAIYHNKHEGTSSSITYKCGGSLISASHVLTAAHCTIDKLINRPMAKHNINIILGTHSIKSFSSALQFKLVDRLAIHPEYNPQTPYKDIAVLKLNSPAEFTGAVRPVCLWPEDKVDLSNVVGKSGSVVGWGYDELGLLAEELMLAKLPVVSELDCVRSNIFYYKYTNNFTFCAGLHRDRSVCNGDSGGGMVFKLRSGSSTEGWFLRGIVSLHRFTDTPCDPSNYVIFTDVAKYLDWIKDSISRDMT